MKNKVFDAIHRRLETEPYANKLGLRLISLDYGYSTVEMSVTEEMENMFGMAHGGAIFSLIDEAFEAASNSHGTISVALSMNVSYVKPPSIGDILCAEAKEVSKTERIGNYDIKVRNNRGDLIATCQAMVYRKQEKLPFLN
jgi:acyl-CoA thioesterase